MNILVTGGAGYLGSHTVLHLIKKKHKVVIIDDYSNSSIDVIKNLEKICNKKIENYNLDLKNIDALKKVFQRHDFDAVIHFAGHKAVGESVLNPIKYYTNNINSTLNIISMMNKFEVNKMVFSSSATVYGDPEKNPIDEESKTQATNPYGRTKLFIEKILKDYSKTNSNFSVSILRYFNPVGAHSSGLIGENPKGIPNNLVPYLSQVASGRLPKLFIFGNDYKTKDGTGIRDYIHVEDLAIGHVKALDYINDNIGYHIHNLGTGKGYSVLEIVKMYERVSNKKIHYEFHERRKGDIPVCYAKTDKALKELGWKAKKNLRQMLMDSWNYEKNYYLKKNK